mgnify:CR=1 FL=1
MSSAQRLDFAGLGASKCGSTWIHRCLADHPEVCASDPKELDFFKEHGPEYSLDALFSKHFAHCSTEKTRGHVTPAYFENMEAPAVFARDFPNLRLFVCLRDPIDRYCSAYYFHLAGGRQKFPSLDVKIQSELNNGDSKDLRKGRYAEHLKRWREHFPTEQILVLFYDDITTDPVAFIQRIYAHIGADATFVPPAAASEKQTKRVTQRSRALHKAIAMTRRLFTQGPLQPVLPLARRVGLGAAKNALLKRNVVVSNNTPPPPLDPGLLAQLRAYYLDDIQELERLTDRKLSQWIT